jgi:hypothetical protein
MDVMGDCKVRMQIGRSEVYEKISRKKVRPLSTSTYTFLIPKDGALSEVHPDGMALVLILSCDWLR